MNTKNNQETQIKLTKGLLDMIILQYLEKQGMHGYQIITNIRKGFGVYFGPSTIYPLLGQLEKNGNVSSVWDMTSDRPRKVYTLTEQGKSVLKFTENSLLMICQKISSDLTVKVQMPEMVLA